LYSNFHLYFLVKLVDEATLPRCLVVIELKSMRSGSTVAARPVALPFDLLRDQLPHVCGVRI
jgi:hypothetical protein